jgi:hypothetical protein
MALVDGRSGTTLPATGLAARYITKGVTVKYPSPDEDGLVGKP